MNPTAGMEIAALILIAGAASLSAIALWLATRQPPRADGQLQPCLQPVLQKVTH